SRSGTHAGVSTGSAHAIGHDQNRYVALAVPTQTDAIQRHHATAKYRVAGRRIAALGSARPANYAEQLCLCAARSAFPAALFERQRHARRSVRHVLRPVWLILG